MTRTLHRRKLGTLVVPPHALRCVLPGVVLLSAVLLSAIPASGQYYPPQDAPQQYAPQQNTPPNYGVNQYLPPAQPNYAPQPPYNQPVYQQPPYQQQPAYSQQQPVAAPTQNFGSPNPYLPQGPTTAYQPGSTGFAPPPPPGMGPSGPMINPGNGAPFNPPTMMDGSAPEWAQQPPNTTPLDVYVEETRTGRFMFGVAVNSDAGVTGQITIDERNFDIMRPATSWDDFMNGTAWRGAGQGFRIEAQPGTQVQRYMVSFTDPYFLYTNISFSASAFYFDRGYYDWSESRYGGRLAFGYRLTPDLSVTTALRAENVDLFNPRVNTVPELNAAVGKSDIFSGKLTLTHDTRDLPFMPTEGHLIDLSYEQAFGDYDFPRAGIDYYQYFLLNERPDGSGRHTLAFSSRLGITGSQTPIFENYFAGGFSTLRGYSFRGASPIENGVRVGGELSFLNSVEYFFPLTADDMVKGTVFVDFGTVERDLSMSGDNFRVAPGFGLRINVPALGPAPLALDFAFPIASAAGDDEQMFSFFFGLSRQ